MKLIFNTKRPKTKICISDVFGNIKPNVLLIQGVPKQADIFKSLIWDFLMIINYKFYFGEEDITFDILVDLMTLFQWGILKFTI